MPEAKFHRNRLVRFIICCLMVIWTPGTRICFPGTGEGRTVVVFPVPGHAGNSARTFHVSLRYLPTCSPELHDGWEVEIK